MDSCHSRGLLQLVHFPAGDLTILYLVLDKYVCAIQVNDHCSSALTAIIMMISHLRSVYHCSWSSMFPYFKTVTCGLSSSVDTAVSMLQR